MPRRRSTFVMSLTERASAERLGNGKRGSGCRHAVERLPPLEQKQRPRPLPRLLPQSSSLSPSPLLLTADSPAAESLPAWLCPSLAANRQLIANFLPTADRSVLIELTCQLIAQSSVGCAGPHRAMDPLSRFNSAHRVTSVGNRQRPHHGGTHARRIRGTPTCHLASPQRPTCPVHLSGPEPLPGLVLQVVAPLPRIGHRGPV